MIAALAAVAIAWTVIVFCTGHKIGYQSAVVDWHRGKRIRQRRNRKKRR